MTRDWSKERWRKQYVSEPLQHRLWPVMARGLAELLNALAEDDGTLVRDTGEPIEALVRALGPQPAELELVRAAIELLVREGLLGRDARSIWSPDSTLTALTQSHRGFSRKRQPAQAQARSRARAAQVRRRAARAARHGP